jgi:hypothetical protein
MGWCSKVGARTSRPSGRDNVEDYADLRRRRSGTIRRRRDTQVDRSSERGGSRRRKGRHRLSVLRRASPSVMLDLGHQVSVVIPS